MSAASACSAADRSTGRFWIGWVLRLTPSRSLIEAECAAWLHAVRSACSGGRSTARRGRADLHGTWRTSSGVLQRASAGRDPRGLAKAQRAHTCRGAPPPSCAGAAYRRAGTRCAPVRGTRCRATALALAGRCRPSGSRVGGPSRYEAYTGARRDTVAAERLKLSGAGPAECRAPAHKHAARVTARLRARPRIRCSAWFGGGKCGCRGVGLASAGHVHYGVVGPEGEVHARCPHTGLSHVTCGVAKDLCPSFKPNSE